MNLLKKIWNKFTQLVGKWTPWMGPLSWLALLTSSIGFLFGSEGNLLGTGFWVLFWLVGAFIMDGYLKMNQK
jgi:hypothetical protein